MLIALAIILLKLTASPRARWYLTHAKISSSMFTKRTFGPAERDLAVLCFVVFKYFAGSFNHLTTTERVRWNSLITRPILLEFSGMFCANSRTPRIKATS
eukprot:Pompholyxophrys_sp_v1_NODE_77_length_2346_cov_4.460733.p4 type:complete len:100 gc:universal NODE_77_length_2346_cov_4.460733:1941-1642(-)